MGPRNVAYTSEEWEDWVDFEKAADGGHESPCALTNTPSSPLSEGSRKRKSSSDSQINEPVTKKPNLEQVSAQNKSHSIVEKRYRTNLNTKIAELSICLPKLRGEGNIHSKDENEGPILKHNKATVMTEAIAYIQHLERHNALLEQTITVLQKHSESEQAPISQAGCPMLVRDVVTSSEAPQAAPVSTKSETDVSEDSKTINGMIHVPDEWRKLWRGELHRYSPTSDEGSEKAKSSPSSSPTAMSKGRYAMIGTLAGLAVLDGFSATPEQRSSDRGLSALPLIRRLPQPSYNMSPRSLMTHPLMSFSLSPFLISLLKAFAIFSVLGTLLFIYLFTSRPPNRKVRMSPPPKTKDQLERLQPAPSLASPLEVRQRAFLTALQTIWVPRHHVLPELLALNVETAAYVVRQVLGWTMYSWVTGRSEEEEIARVRAWDIAIDAQLSGGDAEISKSRLVLSLWASGTLPNTPARLMLKALHIRILFWQPSSLPWVTKLLHKIARKLARWQWNRAFRLQACLDTFAVASDAANPDRLPDHLKALLNFASDVVMTDDVIERANNLAWNTPTPDRDHLEDISDDNAMRGPLDAIASWTSSTLLTSTLKSALTCTSGILDGDILHQLVMATDSSPPGSLCKTRCIAATAVLCNTNRLSHVQRLVETLIASTVEEDALGMMIDSEAFRDSLNELPKPDNQDLSICAKCALAVLESYDEDRYDPGKVVVLSQSLRRLQFDVANIGLLGWTALYQSILYAGAESYGDCANTKVLSSLVQPLTQSLPASAHLNPDTACLVLGAFDRLPFYERTKSRRTSAASDDTGYASMSTSDDTDSRIAIDA